MAAQHPLRHEQGVMHGAGSLAWYLMHILAKSCRKSSEREG